MSAYFLMVLLSCRQTIMLGSNKGEIDRIMFMLNLVFTVLFYVSITEQNFSSADLFFSCLIQFLVYKYLLLNILPKTPVNFIFQVSFNL
jgi:hypothetical protein